MKKPKKDVVPRVNLVFETFRDIGIYERANLEWVNPVCINQDVRVRKYRVTVEPVEEPIEALHARLQTLWDESKNSHDIAPLRRVAEELGYELKGNRGNGAR